MSSPGSRLVALLVVSLIPSVGLGAIEYTVTDLGTLGGTTSRGQAINDSGQVVGYSTIAGDTETHAFLYSGGTMQDLGTLGGADSWAWGINNNGQVVGEAHTAGLETRAFLYSGGTMQDLGTLGGPHSTAVDINDSGQIVGMATTTTTNDWEAAHAFLYSGGTMQDLGTLGGNLSWATAINESGQVAGGSWCNGGVDLLHAFTYSGATMQDIGTLGLGYANFSNASDINDMGQVVGTSGEDPGIEHAFLYGGGTMQDLGTLGGTNSWAWDINNHGQVVGSSNVSHLPGQPEKTHAFVCSSGSMSDLNDLIDPASGWELTDASDINNVGQIVGIGELNGETRAFLLTPIPEPATVWLLAIGTVAVIRRRHCGWR